MERKKLISPEATHPTTMTFPEFCEQAKLLLDQIVPNFKHIVIVEKWGSKNNCEYSILVYGSIGIEEIFNKKAADFSRRYINPSWNTPEESLANLKRQVEAFLSSPIAAQKQS